MPTALRTPGIRLFAGLLGLCALVLSSALAFGQTENMAAIDKMTKLNKKAVDEYQNLNFEEARKLLKDALDVAGETGLDAHPVSARTYVHLGVVVLAGFKQKDEAIKLFRKALDIQRDIKLDKSLANPEIQEVFDEAVTAQAEPLKPPKPAAGEGITHEPVTQSRQGAPIAIKATVDPGLGAKKVVLSFSADGAEDFAEKEMKEDPPGSGSWTAEIPPSATQGGVVDYFIEASGEDDKVVAAKGSNDKTMKIAMLGPNGQPVLAAGKKKKNPPKPEPEEGPSWFIGLGLGSGVGWTTGKGEVTDQDVIKPAGFEPSQLMHFSPEVGYFVSPDMLVSVQLRLQLVTGGSSFYGDAASGCGTDGVCSPAWNALAGFGRISFFLGEGEFRPYVAGIAGVGQIRHVAKFESIQICGKTHDQTCTDTVVAGPVFVGGGGGFLYALSPSFALTLGANALLGFTAFTFHVDINAGVALTF